MAWDFVLEVTGSNYIPINFEFEKYEYRFTNTSASRSTGLYPSGSAFRFFEVGAGSSVVISKKDSVHKELLKTSQFSTGSGNPSLLVYRQLLNTVPTVDLTTTDARTLYENDTINVGGTVQDTDAGNVMMVKYQINNGTTRTIYTSVSDGTAMPFNRVLTFRANKLYDGNNAVTGDLQQGAQHAIKVWAEDDQGGRSADVYRSFQVVPNRPATLTINSVEQQDSLIDSDSITISGSVNDPDGNTVTVEYRLFGESFEQVYNGAGGNFSFNVQLSRLNTGDNNITIRATDSYGATTTRTLKVTKAGTVTPLKRSIATYRINPTNGTAQGVVLWIQRDSGDLNVTLEISATAEGEEEVWEPMTLDSTAFVEDGIEEDEWIYEATEPKEKILLRMTLERENTNSTAGVRLISGVLS